MTFTLSTLTSTEEIKMDLRLHFCIQHNKIIYSYAIKVGDFFIYCQGTFSLTFNSLIRMSVTFNLLILELSFLSNLTIFYPLSYFFPVLVSCINIILIVLLAAWVKNTHGDSRSKFIGIYICQFNAC